MGRDGGAEGVLRRDAGPPGLAAVQGPGEALGPVVRVFAPGGGLLVGRVRAGRLEVAGSAGFPQAVPRVLSLPQDLAPAPSAEPCALTLAAQAPSGFRNWLEAAGMTRALWVPLGPAGGRPGDVLILVHATTLPAAGAGAGLAAVGVVALGYLRGRPRAGRERGGARLGALICGADGRIRSADQAARQMLAVRGDGADVRGQSLAAILGADFTLDLAACLEGAPARRRAVASTRGGPSRLGVTLHRLDGPEPAGAVAVLVREVARVRLRRDDAPRRRLAALGQLAAGAAHEIRNPLAAVRGFLQLVSAQLQDQEQSHYLRIVDHEIDRIDRLTRDILLMSHTDDETRVPCAIGSVIATVAELLRPQAQAAGVQVVPVLAPDLPLVEADPYRLEQVVLNLVRNALDATPTGGTVQIGARAPRGWLEVAVRDEGRGIPSPTLARIFEPFFTTKPGGTGLGLAVSQNIVRGLGGDITVASPAGQGAVFTFRLPVPPHRA